jgi:type I restriction enzyme S subunit
MRARGKEPKDDKWKKKYKEPVGPGKQNIDNLPNDWVIVTLDQVSGINPRIDKKGIPEYLEVSFVPMPEVGAENGYINVKNTRPFAEVKKGFTSFLEGDVLFAKITPCMENGKMVVVPKLSNGYGFGSTEFHVIRPFYGVNPYFIYYLVSNLSFRKEAAHRMTGAVGQKRVPVSFLIETVMSLPPIKEQDQIIREVQRRISIIDGVDSMIEISLKHADRLRQSILKKAFSGKLILSKEL